MSKPLLLLLLPLACLTACKPKVDEVRPDAVSSTAIANEAQRDTKPGYIAAGITAKDGYIVGCGTDVTGKPMVAKFSATGAVLWNKTYDEEKVGVLSGIVETKEGNYALCGTVVSDSGDHDTRVTVIDGTGQLIWQRTTGDVKDEIHPCIGLFGNEVIVTVAAYEADGGHDMVFHFVHDDRPATSEIFTAAGHQIPYSIAATTSPSVPGTVMITGSSHATLASSSKMMMGLYAVGMPVTKNTLDGGHVISRHLINLTGNTLMACGSTSSAGKCKGFMAKTDNLGKVLWHKEYGAEENMLFSCVAKDNDGFVAAGHIYSTDEHGTTECVLVKMDKDGNELWRKTLGSNTNINDEAVSVHQRPDGSYALLCNSTDNNNSTPVYKYYLSNITAPQP